MMSFGGPSGFQLEVKVAYIMLNRRCALVVTMFYAARKDESLFITFIILLSTD